MISAPDLLYLVLAVCVVILTIVLIMLGFQVMEILRDIKRISQSVDQMTALVERVAAVTFPGVERLAKQANRMENKVASFIEKKVDKLTKSE